MMATRMVIRVKNKPDMSRPSVQRCFTEYSYGAESLDSYISLGSICHPLLASELQKLERGKGMHRDDPPSRFGSDVYKTLTDTPISQPRTISWQSVDSNPPF
jgi:hypothetical protein